jgi:hypothetical protein
MGVVVQDNDAVSFRCFLGWIAMMPGAFVGWGLVELSWRFVNPQGLILWERPERGWGYALIALFCSLSTATIALALLRFRDLPSGDRDDLRST